MNISYTVSARKSIGIEIIDWIEKNYYPLEQIDSVFGFTEFTTLYGGRPYYGGEIQDIGLTKLYDNGIGYRIPLTNHDASFEEYKESEKFLVKHHREGNTIICVNDDLAEWIKNDYPEYRVEASVIKKLDTLDKIDKALLLYDSVVLPPDINENSELLESIQDKNRIRLFSRATCMYNCKHKICYKSFSKWMKKQTGELLCSQGLKARDALGVIEFDLAPLIEMGFTKFKAVPRG